MKHMKAALALCALLCMLAPVCLADSYGTAVIDGKSSTKVHLREEATSDSASKGLFFTGAEVELRSDPDEKWVKVRVEGLSGYIRSTYLRANRSREDVNDAAWTGVIDAKNYVNFRRGPSKEFNLVGRIDAGEVVDILGETADGWYYVEYDGDWGYVSTNLVNVIGKSTQSSQAAVVTPVPQAPVQTQPPAVGVFPGAMPASWTHLSGAGAWSTQLLLDSDGFFYGWYSDAEGSIVYESTFNGRFTDVRRVSAYAYVMTLSTFHVEGTPGEAQARNGILYITQEPAGLALGDSFTLYVPGTPKDMLSQEELSWLQDESGNTLRTYYLCNRNTGRGFVPGAQFQ